MQQRAPMKSFGRRLHNSLVALAASAALLLAGLVAVAVPQALPVDGSELVAVEIEQAALVAPAVAEVALPVAAALEAEAPKPRKQKPRRSRQTLAMPYFSFATRS